MNSSILLSCACTLRCIQSKKVASLVELTVTQKKFPRGKSIIEQKVRKITNILNHQKSIQKYHLKHIFYNLQSLPFMHYHFYVISIICWMSEKKSNRGTATTKIKDISFLDQLFIPNEHQIVVYHAQFYKNNLLTCTKHGMTIYDLQKKMVKSEMKLKCHYASFIPNSHYIALAGCDKNEQANTLLIWNYQSNIVDANMLLTFEIQSIKASHRCISITSRESLYVIHFPSLKPIFNEHAGNGLNLVYDISKEGLTLVYNTDIKGQVCIRNFTNKQTNRLISDIRSQSNRVSDRLRRNSRSRIEKQEEQFQKNDIRGQRHIKAHHQNISLLRLSPNGYRFISSSTKGTVLRLFSTLNGELMSSFLINNTLSAIIDINFMADGSAIICLDELNNIRLFNTKMSQQEKICQIARNGLDIYQHDNPTSWLSFLGFLDEQFRYERPFAHFNLESLSKLEEMKPLVHKKSHRGTLTEIKEEPHEKQSIIIQQHLVQDSNIGNQSIKQVHVQQLEINQIMGHTLSNSEIPNIRKSNNSSADSKNGNPHRLSHHSLQKKKSHASPSIKSLGKKQAQVIQMTRPIDLNFRGAIMFQNHISVKVFKGKYYYELKYDPFNGGQMMSKHPKLNLLDAFLALNS